LDGDGDGVLDARDRCPRTSDRSRKVDRFGCYVKTQVTVADEMQVTFLFDFDFDFDSAAIKDVHRKSAQDVARFVRGGKDTRIALGGHTDSIGDSQYNQALSERRAAAVKELLARTLNVPASAISVRGFGEARPEVVRETRANRRLNRRVEATVTTKRTRSR
jgi:OOP family OmpA-OmpF porin